MIQGRCPICSKSFQADRIEDLPTFPFCSERCRLVDLGRWIDESYAVPGPPAEFDPESPDAPPRSPESNGRASHDD